MITLYGQSIDTGFIIQWILTGSFVSTLLFKGAKVYKRDIKPTLEDSGRFYKDWHGYDARPGVPRQPGVMERLQSLETDVQFLKRMVMTDAPNNQT